MKVNKFYYITFTQLMLLFIQPRGDEPQTTRITKNINFIQLKHLQTTTEFYYIFIWNKSVIPGEKTLTSWVPQPNSVQYSEYFRHHKPVIIMWSCAGWHEVIREVYFETVVDRKLSGSSAAVVGSMTSRQSVMTCWRHHSALLRKHNHALRHLT